MAGEIIVRQFIYMKKGNFLYGPPQSSFNVDMDVDGFGPTPGAKIATYAGIDIDLSEFDNAAWCDLINYEPSDGVTVSWGIYDPQVNRYYPIGKLEPGWRTILCLDELFGGEFYPASGTGSQLVTNKLRIKAKNGTEAKVFVGVFEGDATS